MSYEQFAKLSDCSVDDVIKFCKSRFGCTKYDAKSDRYIILCNEQTNDNNNIGRQAWTLAHEIGHIVCNHHKIILYSNPNSEKIVKSITKDFESEADYFTAMLLSPFPIFGAFNIHSAIDFKNTFGLSMQAARNRFAHYQRWKLNHRKTSWEHDMLNTITFNYLKASSL
jgi:Zn-dependent peptidase ImmA (M78 family)